MKIIDTIIKKYVLVFFKKLQFVVLSFKMSLFASTNVSIMNDIQEHSGEN